MKFRKLARLCEHDEIKGHPIVGKARAQSIDVIGWCPGGVFLPDDTLIIEKVDIDREALAAALEPRLIDPVFLPIYQAAKLVLDALSVREDV